MGGVWGLEVPALFRARRGLREPTLQALERLRHRRRRMPQGAARRRPRSISPPSRATRCPARQAGSLARPAARLRAAQARPGAARADAGRDGQAQGRPHRLQLGRRRLVDHGLLLSSRNGTCAGSTAIAATGVTVRDISDAVIGFSLSGPNARRCSNALTHQDVSNAALRLHGLRRWTSASCGRRSARLSVTGELGYEINCRANEHAGLRRTLLAAGGDLGVSRIRL